MNTPLAGAPGGRVAIVTGGSRGVGRATVGSLARRGYAVVVNYLHDQRAAETTVETVLADKGFAVAVRADVADELDVQRLFAETITTFGGIDVVVHAVVGPVAAAPVALIDLGEFDALCRINTRAVLLVNREAARRLRGGGAIVNLTSSGASPPTPGYGALAAAKAAVDALTRVLALELSERHITVNAVSLPLDLPCAAGAAVDVLAYLLSDDGRFLTGHVIPGDDPGQDCGGLRNGELWN
jgi:3-oxoacyl-[acyl-carrier protein] reductase